MNPYDLTPVEARATVRRHAHDLRNMINSMDLEIVCLMEESPAENVLTALQKIREELLLTERMIFSLSVRFREPSIHPAAATDIFYNWKQQLYKLGQDGRFQWEEPVCTAGITVDFTAIIAVLGEICLHVKTPAGAPPPRAALSTEGDHVVFCVQEPPAENRFPMDGQQRQEWERLVEISGGRMEVTSEEDESAPRITRLIFPCASFAPLP